MNREIIHSKTLPEPTTLNELAKTFVVNSKVDGIFKPIPKKERRYCFYLRDISEYYRCGTAEAEQDLLMAGYLEKVGHRRWAMAIGRRFSLENSGGIIGYRVGYSFLWNHLRTIKSLGTLSIEGDEQDSWIMSANTLNPAKAVDFSEERKMSLTSLIHPKIYQLAIDKEEVVNPGELIDAFRVVSEQECRHLITLMSGRND